MKTTMKTVSPRRHVARGRPFPIRAHAWKAAAAYVLTATAPAGARSTTMTDSSAPLTATLTATAAAATSRNGAVVRSGPPLPTTTDQKAGESPCSRLPVSPSIARHPVTARAARTASPSDHRIGRMPPVAARPAAGTACLPAEDSARVDGKRYLPHAGGGLAEVGMLWMRCTRYGHQSSPPGFIQVMTSPGQLGSAGRDRAGIGSRGHSAASVRGH